MRDIQPEILDINEMINRFEAANCGEVAFICGFVAFEEDGKPRLDANFCRMSGHYKELNEIIKDMTRMIKFKRDREGFVNL